MYRKVLAIGFVFVIVTNKKELAELLRLADDSLMLNTVCDYYKHTCIQIKMKTGT